MLAITGFIIMTAIMILMFTKKASVIVALLVTPIIGCIIIGQGANIGKYITTGVTSMAGTTAMFLFAMLFFGLMRDNGAFDPIVKFIVKSVGGNPVLVCIGAYVIGLIGQLDGSGPTTYLLVVPAMLPIFKKLKMNPLVLGCIAAISSGAANLLPWSGPALRASSVMGMTPSELVAPMVIPQMITIVFGCGLAAFLGSKEKKRLTREGILDITEKIEHSYEEALSDREKEMRRPKLVVFNVLLIVAVLVSMLTSFIDPIFAFMLAFVVCLVVNYPDPDMQRKLIDDHAKELMLTIGVVISAGALSGILKESGMAEAMAKAVVAAIPQSFGAAATLLVGFLSVPMSMFADVDTWSFGIMPVMSNAVQALGVPAVDIARAGLTGFGTLGFPVAPLNGAPFLLVGLLGVDFSDHQRFSIKYAWLTSAFLMTVALLMGVFTIRL